MSEARSASPEPEIAAVLRGEAAKVASALRRVIEAGEAFPAFVRVVMPDGSWEGMPFEFADGPQKVAWRRAYLAAVKGLDIRGVLFASDCWTLRSEGELKPDEERRWREHGIHDDPRRTEALVIELFAPGWLEDWHFPYRREGKRIVWGEESREREGIRSRWNPWPREPETAG